ncbi:MAG: hypothetical protein DMD74_10775 [Gemmatimonadetes bacterium]|nr:MAG: hypothetical protein DMD74_10775 [Gemmatimonadota bacterium]
MSRLSLALCVLIAAPSAAQAPRITPAGDPSVKSDTIYRLAVNPADYQDQTFVYLLDDGVLRFEADGRSSRTYRQVVQILSQDAVEGWAEQSFSYTVGHERLTVNWVRVLKPDGTVISAQPSREQESLAPVAMEAPVYSDTKVRRVALGGVAPNTLIDYSYTIERLQPNMPGDFFSGWRVTTGRLTRRSRLIVDVPASPLSWADISRWYAGVSRDRFVLSPEVEREIATVVSGATTLDDSLRALHRWVAQDFRYVSIALGTGGYVPRLPAQVLETRYGDCKDKATLFIAAARRFGVQANPVLLSSSGGADSTMPTLAQFDHMIAAVERPAGRLYLDLTAELTPYGELPFAEQGSFAVVVRPDGTGEPVTLPVDSAGANRSETHLVGDLSADGMFSGRFTETSRGAQQYQLRSALARELTPIERQRFSIALANELAPGAAGDSLQIFNGRDLTAQPRISLLVRGARMSRPSGKSDILTLPLRNFASLDVVSRLEAHLPRRFPIDVGEVVGPVKLVGDFELTLPAGWTADLPPNVSETSEFGSYTAEYVQTGRLLHVKRTIVGRKGAAPPDRAQALIAWLRAVSKDDVSYIVLQHGQ